MTAKRSDHWDAVYAARRDQDLTWFEETPAVSLGLVTEYLRPGAGVLDVGGGSSRLVDRLLTLDAGPIAVLDISAAALLESRRRLGDRAGEVEWINADITRFEPDRRWSIWHDRAVFHFLTAEGDRAAYLDVMDRALAPGGTAIIATFAEDGPETCSNLPVMRYGADDLAREISRLRPGMLVSARSLRHMHVTPKGNRQSFQFSIFEKADAGGSGAGAGSVSA